MVAFHPDVLTKLRAIDTPTICNLIEVFGIRPQNTGFMDSRIRACFPEMPPMVGFAATATFRSSAPCRDVDSYAGTADQVERFAELSGPAVVVFQDLDDPCVSATFGEVMCTTYKAFGAAGLITSGAGRDLEQVRAIGFPAFTNGSICAHGYCHIPHIHVPVRVGGIVVQPNDLLHGDMNGVTTIPHEIASEVAGIADEYIAAEMIVINAMRTGPATPKLLREAQTECSARIAKLRTMVSRVSA